MLADGIARIRRNGWMGWALLAAAAYNIAWGALVVVFPLAPFRWAGLAPPSYPEIWQCLGMVVGVYGVGYAIAASNPLRHWPIVLVGLLGKVLGPIGFLLAAADGRLPWVAGLMNLTNDLVWWIPFTLILVRAARERRGHAHPSPPVASADHAVPASLDRRE
jgi:hypothetical protein